MLREQADYRIYRLRRVRGRRAGRLLGERQHRCTGGQPEKASPRRTGIHGLWMNEVWRWAQRRFALE